VRLSGSADAGYFGGGDGSVDPGQGFDIWDARIFIDAELGESLDVADLFTIRNIGFTFEWNLVRTGHLYNDVGLLYLDFEGIAESSWLNVRVGRFQIPFGESYKLYSKGYAERFFVRQPVGGPWWWDEGALVHGADPEGRFGYVSSVTNGDNEFNDAGGGTQLTFKLWAQPTPWFYASGSGLWTSELGDTAGALWLGEAWARPFGQGSGVSNVVDGVIVPDDAEGLGSLWAAGGDVILTPLAGLRLWLAGGYYRIDSRGDTLYDRALTYWLAELVVGGELISPRWKPLFVGLRAGGLSTCDNERGYLLDRRYSSSLGYNMENMLAYTAVAGWHLGEYVTLRAEYSHRDVDLVRGAAAALPEREGNEDVYSVEVGLHF
jgi:hypothetical protein